MKPAMLSQSESEMAGRAAAWVTPRKPTTNIDPAGIAAPRSTAEAALLAQQGVRLVVHRHTVLNVGAAMAKRARRAAKIAKLQQVP